MSLRTPKLLVPSVLLCLVATACGRGPAPATAPPDGDATMAAPGATAKPVEAAPFTLTYSYTEAGKKEPLALVIISSDGAVSAIEDKPARHFAGTLDADKTADIARIIANPELRKLSSSPADAAGAVVQLELLDAKGALWRLRSAGESPDGLKPMRNFIDQLQADLKGEKRPPAIALADVMRGGAAKDGPPAEHVRILANTLIMVRTDGKPSAYGNVAVSDVETLRVGTAALDKLQSTAGTPSADSRVVRVERDEAGVLERRFDGGVPLAVEALLARVDDMKAQAKPLAPFDLVTYEYQATAPKKGPLEVLTVDPLGKLTLTIDGKPAGTGEATEQDLFNVYSTLAGLEKAESAKPGPREPIITLRLAAAKGAREVRFGIEPPTGTARLVAALDRMKAQVAPAPAEKPATP